MTPADFLRDLESFLTQRYSMPGIGSATHDVEHVRRVVALGQKIAAETSLVFDPDEYVAAAWLHNLDRVPGEEGLQRGSTMLQLLANSPFDGQARKRIIDAVVQHSKKDDEPGDSSLLTALRIADKLDSLGPIGIMRSIAARPLPFYDPKDPFSAGSTEEVRLRNAFDDFFRVLEWVGMLPSGEARGLIVRRHLHANIQYVRALGAEIAERYGVEDGTEGRIMDALGEHYEVYAV